MIDALKEIFTIKNISLFIFMTAILALILNYLYDGRVDRLSLDKFYDFINYLEDIKVNIELIECFNKIVVGGNNINPCNYLDTLTPKQVAGARRLYKKK